ncbi:hypothetical protein [Erythrobacter donghaensis]|uniref:hypothetical protein n=1 Tax=Erythrobacter donghaensis TaxID=267135 RepID=UPI00093D56E3|nr:hypothetical protein [Erythrobacter donghaensis]
MGVLLSLGTCQAIRYSEQSAIRARLPAELGNTSFVAFDVCDRLFGGYSYIIAIPPEVSLRVQAQGPEFLEYTHHAPSHGKAKWEPTERYAWRRDGSDSGLPGLLCLNRRPRYNGERLIDHIFRKGSYIAHGGRESVIIIPSLNIVIGGFDPR